MADIITDRSGRSEILSQLLNNHAGRDIFHKAPRKNKPAGWTVWGEQISQEFEGLGINFWDEDDFTTMIVWQTDRKAELHITLGPSENPSAGFARLDDGVWLLRTRRVNAKQRPLKPTNEKALVNGRSYFKISTIDDPHFIGKVFEFHLSREPSAEIEEIKGASVGDYRVDRGASPHERERADVHPLHPLVCDALAAALGLDDKSGLWKRLDRRRVPVDLYLSKETQNYIFEVKPYTNITTVAEAIGQLLIYRHSLNDFEARLFAVLPREGCTQILEAGLRAQGIGIIFFDWDGNTPVFSRSNLSSLTSP